MLFLCGSMAFLVNQAYGSAPLGSNNEPPDRNFLMLGICFGALRCRPKPETLEQTQSRNPRPYIPQHDPCCGATLSAGRVGKHTMVALEQGLGFFILHLYQDTLTIVLAIISAPISNPKPQTLSPKPSTGHWGRSEPR